MPVEISVLMAEAMESDTRPEAWATSGRGIVMAKFGRRAISRQHRHTTEEARRHARQTNWAPVRTVGDACRGRRVSSGTNGILQRRLDAFTYSSLGFAVFAPPELLHPLFVVRSRSL